ncbi:hypothetical protein OIU76_000978 [Salix suchowensis]|nr:hypothetical protein OIU76_000978 [Salix suchowensis]
MMMASRGGATKLASSMMLLSRSFSAAAARGMFVKEAVPARVTAFHGDAVRGFLVRGSEFGFRHGSNASFSEKDQQQNAQLVSEGGDKEEKQEIMAYWTVKSLRRPVDLFFQKRYGCRAMMLETVAAVPGMVGGMLLHCRSLRKFEHSGGWIKALIEEAENERMHLMTFMEVAQPRWYERALVFTVQGVFFNAYFLGYLISPKFAHRVVGYLEEEAIHSYTEFLAEVDRGNIENVPAPAIAIDYWRLPPESTLRDVVVAVRADEAHHRDVNHFASDIHFQGRELKEAPAPVGYH